uniref:IP15639p n=1 Tax=Drosophila melanogaster TaxID=7227 RepID=Q1WWF0_DROME|nr:IP15639p [Drosophila melanogaster]
MSQESNGGPAAGGGAAAAPPPPPQYIITTPSEVDPDEVRSMADLELGSPEKRCRYRVKSSPARRAPPRWPPTHFR